MSEFEFWKRVENISIGEIGRVEINIGEIGRVENISINEIGREGNRVSKKSKRIRYSPINMEKSGISTREKRGIIMEKSGINNRSMSIGRPQ